MKFVIAPSKTMVETTQTPSTDPLFPHKRDDLLEGLASMSVKQLMALYSVNESIAALNKERFMHFQEAHCAIFSYTGQQYKHKNLETLDKAALNHLSKNIYIMSGLYGLVRPFDRIGLYRMPMGVKWNGAPLKNFWKETISEYLRGETVVNLASKEYADAIDRAVVDVIDVDFMVVKQGKRKRAGAMEAKKHRGRMIHFIATHHIEHIEALKDYAFEGMRFETHEAGRLVFSKQ